MNTKNKIIALCLSFIPLFATLEREVEDTVALLEQKTTMKADSGYIGLNGTLVMHDLYATVNVHFDVEKTNGDLIEGFFSGAAPFTDEMIQQLT